MKEYRQLVKINGIKEENGQSIVQAALPMLKDEILRYMTPEGLYAEIRFQDKRQINHEQRKKFYAMVADISEYTGYEPEYLKEMLKFWYCAESGQEYFSMSDCSLETARELITFTIEFALMNDIPLSAAALERTEDISKYLFHCIKYKKCCICGNEGITYTLDKEKNKMCLCDNHYDMAKVKGLEDFGSMYKVYGVQAL